MTKGWRIDLSGVRFGRLTCVEVTICRGARGWKCRCDCGKEVVVQTRELRSGNTRSCGCLALDVRKKHPPGGAGLLRLYKKYKNAARHAGREFRLTIEKFNQLTRLPCSYCGAEPQRTENPDGCSNYSAYKYNGLDRVDSSKGYTPENVVPCCWYCNIAKHDRSVDEFLAWARRVVGRVATI